jgi:hypothetical protein
MIMLFKSSLFICLYLFFCNSVKAQETIKYDVSIAGISIGEMIAKKEQKNQEIHYELKSNVSFWFFGKINLDYLTHAVYQGKKLVSAKMDSKTNRGDFNSNILWKEDHYEIHSSNYKHELDTTIYHPFEFSAAVFYFEEPKNVDKFLAEAYGLPSPIFRKKDFYEVDVNGNKNRFYYKEGKLEKAVMEFPIKNYVIKRKE